jgi:hypothetical protein
MEDLINVLMAIFGTWVLLKISPNMILKDLNENKKDNCSFWAYLISNGQYHVFGNTFVIISIEALLYFGIKYILELFRIIHSYETTPNAKWMILYYPFLSEIILFITRCAIIFILIITFVAFFTMNTKK